MPFGGLQSGRVASLAMPVHLHHDLYRREGDPPRLHQSLHFSGTQATHGLLAAQDDVFRFCVWESAEVEGAHIDGVFLSCRLLDVHTYWAFFNTALFVDCTFERCTFRGASFDGCRFLACEFRSCAFAPDNLGAPCRSENTTLDRCAFVDCHGVPVLWVSSGTPHP